MTKLANVIEKIEKLGKQFAGAYMIRIILTDGDPAKSSHFCPPVNVDINSNNKVISAV